MIYGRVVVPYRPIKVLVIITVPVGSGAGQILCLLTNGLAMFISGESLF